MRIYQLADRAEPNLPRWIGWGADWHRLWERRDSLPGPLGEWFRSLSEPPVECPDGILRTDSLDALEARIYAMLRIRQLTDWCGHHPDFLINPPIGGKPEGKHAVERVCPDGRADRFASIKQAEQETGHCRDAVRRWARGGYADPNGCFWFSVM
jgi:hypothetical protein